MARPPRIEFAGALYHVSAKGRGPLFHDTGDAARLLAILGQVCRRYRWAVLAYCLLPERFELVVRTLRPSLSEGMRRVSGLYGQAYNRHHDRQGPLFRGRFKAVLVDGETYLAEVCRAVLRAPVEAGLADQARDWRWSSCRPLLRGDAPEWLAPDCFDGDELLGLFADAPEGAAAAFAAFVEAPASGGDPWSARRAQIYLGSEGFMAEVEALARGALASSDPAAEARKPLAWYAERYPDRREAMARAHLEGGYPQPAVAARFGVHYSTVSRAAARWAAKATGAALDDAA